MPFTKYTPEQQIARFWTYVDRNGPVPECRPDLGTCWLWIGATADGGALMISLQFGMEYFLHRPRCTIRLAFAAAVIRQIG